MKPVNLIQAAILILVVTWIFHQLGELVNPAHSLEFALIGMLISIAVLALVFIRGEISEFTALTVGAISSVSIIVVFGMALADHPFLWVILILLNVPLYRVFAPIFFGNQYDMAFSLENIFTNESGGETEEEVEAGFKGIAFVVICTALVTAQYKLVAYLFY